MSELINNSKIRQNELKELIRSIHHKKISIEEAKKIFREDFGSISTDEIVSLEQSLVADGMEIEEIQSLCDIHAAVFNQSISDIHKTKSVTDIPGHPAKVFSDENKEILKMIEEEIEANLDLENTTTYLKLRIAIDRLSNVSNHYARKEYLFFPPLEKRGITSIPKVMWGVDDEIRKDFKVLKGHLNDKNIQSEEIKNLVLSIVERVRDMVIKEENILLPKLVDTMSLYDWVTADQESDNFGYLVKKPLESWKVEAKEEEVEDKVQLSGNIRFDAGSLSSDEINAIFNTLPLDMTFVDKDGHVKYFTQGKKRIFERPITIIGRHVSLCHPPKSVHIVEEIVESFRTGKKDHEDFYIHMMDMYVYIRYYAIRNKQGEFLGTLEITEDITSVQAISGEKRLMG